MVVDISQGEWEIFGCSPHWKVLEIFAAVFPKKAEPIEMPFGVYVTIQCIYVRSKADKMASLI